MIALPPAIAVRFDPFLIAKALLTFRILYTQWLRFYWDSSWPSLDFYSA